MGFRLLEEIVVYIDDNRKGVELFFSEEDVGGSDGCEGQEKGGKSGGRHLDIYFNYG
jgi:hypothetical protein